VARDRLPGIPRPAVDGLPPPRTRRWSRKDILALSDERDAWQARLLAAEQAAYRRGFAEGYKRGYERAHKERDREFDQWAAGINSGITHAELERRRYGDGGRQSWIIK
jgi:flagellar biosynthesis/type III secretory pathway protein FliH